MVETAMTLSPSEHAVPSAEHGPTAHPELRAKLRAFAARILGVHPEHPDAEDCAQEALSRWIGLVARPAGPEKPGLVARPAGTEKPGLVARPAGTEKPGLVARPAGTEKPHEWGPGPGPGFVFGIARNVALDHLRRRGRRRERFVGAPDSESDLGRLASSAPSPEDALDQHQDDARVSRALDQLPENQRVALRLFYLEHLSYEAIAQRMGVSMGTVATWLSRGKAQLASTLRRAS